MHHAPSEGWAVIDSLDPIETTGEGFGTNLASLDLWVNKFRCGDIRLILCSTQLGV